MNTKTVQILLFLLCLVAGQANAQPSKPNIIIVFADDISARELPIYGSSVWSPPLRGDTSDPRYRASTPVLDQLAREGCWIKTAWASVVCSPSRAMMMTGRYAHLHKWWGNKSKGKYIDEDGKEATWPLYLSSPNQIGHLAQQAGYGTYWAGKTQMAGDLRRFGFDQGCFTPGNLADKDNPHTDFKLVIDKSDGEKVLRNADTNLAVDTYQQHGWYWFPHVRLMNHDGKDLQWWPNTEESKQTFGLGSYGPDIELNFIFDFMEQQVREDEPFFVYHTTHLGHDAFDWLDPDSESSWPGTPVIHWDGEKYTRTEPRITGDQGEYDTQSTVTEPGMHSHVNYLDYQAWLYQNKLKELGIADNTIFIFCADNGTGGYGKNSTDRQKGTHVPLIISAPGLTKQGEQDALVNFCDFLPTIAELTGADVPADYEINGESLVPFLFGDRTEHRDWLYAYKDAEQIIRGKKVMRDGRGKWWDVENTPDDLIRFPQITDWKIVSAEHRDERDMLLAVLPRFDQKTHGKNGPGAKSEPLADGGQGKAVPLTRRDLVDEQKQSWKVSFSDNYEDRTEIGEAYTTARGHDDSWSVRDGVLVGKQTKDDHGAVIRTELDFDDVDIRFDFRLGGGKSFNFVIDDVNETSVHAGHICRASVFPKYIMIGDDKTGAMNLEVRRKRKELNLPKEEADALEELLNNARSSAKATIKPNQWHSLRLRIRGDVMKAFLDDELVTSLKSPGFAHPTKTKFGWTVNGQSIEFDNLVVRQLKQGPQSAGEGKSPPAQENRSASREQEPRAEVKTPPATSKSDRSLKRRVTDGTSPKQPNILWIITDDHRVDSIQAYNQATSGQPDSKLGYVSSPSADSLAKQGVLFTRAYCNSPGCAPSRTSMHFGMYPHHCAQYGFESGHQSADFCQPMFPKLMAELGYQTALFGKSGFASFEWGEKRLQKTTPYQFSIDQKELYKNEAVDWFHQKTWANGKASGDESFWAMPDGGIYIQTPLEGPMSDEDRAKRRRVDEELNLLYRVGMEGNNPVGGVSPQPTMTTQDGHIASNFIDYVRNAGKAYETPWGRKVEGAPTDKPLFVNLGFHFPHTPVLPSREFRNRFAGKTYRVPDFSKDELGKLPPQLVTWFNKSNFDVFEPEAKQQAIRDYYAFCAMGDSLVGKVVEEFKSYSESQDREYVILYVIGDHGWHLGEQGGENKFAPYDTSNHCAVIVVSSDGKRFPAGTVCHDFVEFVDFAPTCLDLATADLTQQRLQHLDGRTLSAILSGESPRDYVIGEFNHVIGPRAYLRSNDFAFSMRVREKNGKPGEKWGHPPGEGIQWGLTAARDDVELALFDLRVDASEQNNVANDPDYQKLADWFRIKLGRIVLGDGRVECDWKQKNKFAVSNFAAGTHDHKLSIPDEIIPGSSKWGSEKAPDLKIQFGPVEKRSVFNGEAWSHWGGSVVKGADGRYHMLYSRWRKKLGWAWVTDSEIAHATASSPFGPFEHQGIALPRRGKEHWDGWCTHNPTVHHFGDKYYLYHMGNTGDGEIVGYPGKHLLNMQHRNNQRIGVAVADSPAGPWTRLDRPVLNVSSDDAAADSLMTSNPSVCQRPDGKILMIYKAVGKEFPMPRGGPVVHMVAIGDTPTGPFKKMRDPVFTFEGERFPAEDPYIWYQEGKYRAIVKRIKHEGNKRVFSLVHYDSIDGIEWQPAKYHEISDRTITWEDGTSEQLEHLERPQVVFEDGKPIALVCAADRIDENNVRQSFNVQIPLVVESR